MSLNQRLFIIVPLVSALCNIFLLLTVLSAKKNKQIYAFMELLCAFTRLVHRLALHAPDRLSGAGVLVRSLDHGHLFDPVFRL